MTRASPACAKCGTSLPEPIVPPTITCPRCGASFAARVVVVDSVRGHKVAGVSRHRYQIRTQDGGDEISFEGPPGLTAARGQTIHIIYREGRPICAVTGSGAIALEPAASDAIEIKRASPLRRLLLGLVWLFLVAALVIAAALCDRGTRPLAVPEPVTTEKGSR